MKLSLQARYKKITAVLVLLVVTFLLIQNAFNTWLAYSYAQGPKPSGLIFASEIESKNPDYYFLTAYYLAEYEYLTSSDIAMDEYKTAIMLSPFNYNYWFHLAELLYNDGNEDKALYALSRATTLSPGSVSLRWRAGMLAAKLGDSQSILENLTSVIKNDKERRIKAYSLLWQSVGNGDKILSYIPDNALYDYYYYLRMTKRTGEARLVYDKLKSLNQDTSTINGYHVSDLIKSGDIRNAKDIWVDNYGNWEGIWNGSFESPLIGAGFGWRISNIDGVKIRRDNEPYRSNFSLMVNFEKQQNIDFDHLRQIIPVDQNTDYRLKLFVKSEEISTASDLTFFVRCLNSRELYVKSDPIYGTQDWQEVSVSFKTPEDCNLVLLSLRRPKSDRINKNISGSLWIDEIELVKESSNL